MCLRVRVCVSGAAAHGAGLPVCSADAVGTWQVWRPVGAGLSQCG